MIKGENINNGTDKIEFAAKKTHIMLIIDKSSSMCGTEKASIEGINNFLKEQKEVSCDATISIAFFSTHKTYEWFCDFEDIKKIKYLCDDDYVPSGLTALNDAVCTSIKSIKKRLHDEKEKPEQVIVCILTDGEENDSREFNVAQTREMIKDCENNLNWRFVYLAANINAFQESIKYCISHANTMQYQTSANGLSHVFSVLSSDVKHYRHTGDTINISKKSDFGDTANKDRMSQK